MRSALRLLPCILAAIGLLLLPACRKPGNPQAEPAPAPAAEPAPAAGPAAGGLDEALSLAIQQLEGEKYAEMLERFVAPADREKVKAEGGSWEKLAEDFGQNKAPALLERLRLAREQKPELSPDGNRAVYPGKPDAPGKGSKELVWERVDGLWYLRN